MRALAGKRDERPGLCLDEVEAAGDAGRAAEVDEGLARQVVAEVGRPLPLSLSLSPSPSLPPSLSLSLSLSPSNSLPLPLSLSFSFSFLSLSYS